MSQNVKDVLLTKAYFIQIQIPRQRRLQEGKKNPQTPYLSANSKVPSASATS